MRTSAVSVPRSRPLRPVPRSRPLRPVPRSRPLKPSDAYLRSIIRDSRDDGSPALGCSEWGAYFVRDLGSSRDLGFLLSNREP